MAMSHVCQPTITGRLLGLTTASSANVHRALQLVLLSVQEQAGIYNCEQLQAKGCARIPWRASWELSRAWTLTSLTVIKIVPTAQARSRDQSSIIDYSEAVHGRSEEGCSPSMLVT